MACFEPNVAFAETQRHTLSASYYDAYYLKVLKVRRLLGHFSSGNVPPTSPAAFLRTCSGTESRVRFADVLAKQPTGGARSRAGWGGKSNTGKRSPHQIVVASFIIQNGSFAVRRFVRAASRVNRTLSGGPMLKGPRAFFSRIIHVAATQSSS